MTGARKAIEAAGARLLCLPPYIPDFNPIEWVFAKLMGLSQPRRPALSQTPRKPFGRHALASQLRSVATALPQPGYDSDFGGF